MRRVENHLLLLWLTFTGVFVFCAIVAWQEGLLYRLIVTDQSKISILIGLMYLYGMFHCARRVLYISEQTESAARAEAILHAAPPGGLRIQKGSVCTEAGQPLPQGVLHDYFLDLLKMLQGSASVREEIGAVRTNLPELYAGMLKGPHEIGWFLSDVMIKLGLLGTIIGFILMLGSVADTSSLDANTMQKVLKQMSSGMGTALFTTLAGLLSSVLMAAQFQMLERGSDQLIEKIVYLADVRVLGESA